MNFVTTIGYHDAGFEVEIIVSKSSETKSEAEKLGDSSDFFKAVLYNDKIVVSKGENSLIIYKEDIALYQFRVCRNIIEKPIVSDKDYEEISWDEAIEYFNMEYKNFSLPFSLEAYYYSVRESDFTFS